MREARNTKKMFREELKRSVNNWVNKSFLKKFGWCVSLHVRVGKQVSVTCPIQSLLTKVLFRTTLIHTSLWGVNYGRCKRKLATVVTINFWFWVSKCLLVIGMKLRVIKLILCTLCPSREKVKFWGAQHFAIFCIILFNLDLKCLIFIGVTQCKFFLKVRNSLLITKDKFVVSSFC